MSYAVIKLLVTIIDLYWYIVIGMAIMSWLIAFDVVNLRSSGAYSLWNALNNLTEPLLRPIRSILPSFGGVDISPVILLLLLQFLRDLVAGGGGFSFG
ncbi:MAG: YggT family protein [Methylocystis sp.]|jgi:YggT family protein|nr:YggT family protein [Alphaproteobacteria bacterium]